MAVASGPPDKRTKAPATPEQRKMYAALGAIGVLSLIVAAMYVPGMLSGGSTPDLPAAPTATNTATAPAGDTPPASADAADAGGAPGGAAPGAAPDGAAPAAGTTTASLGGVPLARSRPDPFQQPYLIPTQPPPLPPPVDIPSPDNSGPIFLPGSNVNRDELRRPLNLPPVSITRLDETARRPTDAFPPRRTAGTGSGGGGGSVSPSFDKRLSGIIIGDGVRALLEIQGPNGVTTRVVQPGDEVDGITVLNIQRFNDGTRTVTRMLIRENGEERSVELKAAPVSTGGLGGNPPL